VASAPPKAQHVARTAKRPTRVILAERSTGALASAVQDAAAAPVRGGAMLLGGLTAADQSRADVRITGARGDRAAGQLPVTLHDTAAVALGRSVYLFGGGTGSNTQSDGIWRVPSRGGAVTGAGRLPAPSSDQSAAAIGGTAYVVGGYTGARWLDTIVAWRPGGAARVVGRLPSGLRYAAVAAAGRTLVIAGGSLPTGTASTAVYAWTPGSARVVRIGTLPAQTTHAAAAAIAGTVYVIGGRGAATGTPTARIVAVDPRAHRVRAAGSLSSPRSDLAAVTVGDRILLAGGRGTDGTEAGLSELVPRAKAVAAPRFTAAASSVYAYDRTLTGAARFAKPLVYVPNSDSNTVDVIDPHTFHVVEHFPVGGLPQHVVPAWDLRSLYVTNDTGNSLTAIDPRTGRPGRTIPVADPYNMYFTPDGRFAIVVAERLQRLDFRDPHTFALRHSLDVPCRGVDHMDFTADGTKLLASCEFSSQMLVVSVGGQRVLRTIDLPHAGAMPQDVKLSPDGRIFYVADMASNGVWEVDAHTFKIVRFQPTGAGAHGLYPSRDGRSLYVTNRAAGSISVLDFRTRRIVHTWRIPGGGSPDMGGVSADGKVLWLSGRYSGVVYAISTTDGKLLARIPVGAGPHGVCVWPQPGRYSLGHTGILR
jgi:YVTN family beta-propeller protein